MTYLTNEIPVVYFHSVAPNKNISWFKSYLTMELEYFEKFLKYLQKNCWQTLFLDELYSLKREKYKHLPPKCCLTFDDGYLDNYLYVWPLLKKYGFKGTIFISPEFVDRKRKDNISNFAAINDRNYTKGWGFLSWNEMKLMQNSGVIDIQSHTLTHTKYFTSDQLVGLHHPGADCLYYVGNEFPTKKPYYINNNKFENLLPYGYPIFTQKSAIVARKITINQRFIEAIIDKLTGFDWSLRNAQNLALDQIKSIYSEWKKNNKIIEDIETEKEYLERVKQEIKFSKSILEEKLKKKISFLCWPHGDNTVNAHRLALDAGYLMTTIGKLDYKLIDDYTKRIPERMSIDYSNYFKRFKTNTKLTAFAGHFPQRQFFKLIRSIRFN